MVFNLDAHRPKVLLLGNGLDRMVSRSTKYSWDELLKKLASREVKKKEKDIPYTVFATAVCDQDDKERQRKIKEAFEGYEYPENDLLNQFLPLGFDAILTTNYTYEVENSMDPAYASLKDKTRKAETFHRDKNGKKRKESSCMLQTYNLLNRKENKPSIWHIHGELRNPNSVILTHDNYGRLIGKIVDYLRQNGNRYQEDYSSLEFRSWIDYLLMGDVYIVGQGFDFSEFDLWWMLSRRMRENADIGKVIFYEAFSQKDKSKQEMLKTMDIDVRNLDFYKIEEDFPYQTFYNAVISDLQKEINQ